MRKKKMEQLFLRKRLKAQRKDLVPQEMTMDLEEIEVKREEVVEKGYLSLGQHRNKQKRKSQKKFWFLLEPQVPEESSLFHQMLSIPQAGAYESIQFHAQNGEDNIRA